MNDTCGPVTDHKSSDTNFKDAGGVRSFNIMSPTKISNKANAPQVFSANKKIQSNLMLQNNQYQY